MDEDAIRAPEARLEAAKLILSLQGFVEMADGKFHGDGFEASIDTARPTQEPLGFGAMPSYVIAYAAR